MPGKGLSGNTLNSPLLCDGRISTVGNPEESLAVVELLKKDFVKELGAELKELGVEGKGKCTMWVRMAWVILVQ